MFGYLKWAIASIAALTCLRKTSENVGGGFSETVVLSHKSGATQSLPVDTVMNFIQKPPLLKSGLEEQVLMHEPGWQLPGKFVLKGADYHDDVITEAPKPSRFFKPGKPQVKELYQCKPILDSNSNVIGEDKSATVELPSVAAKQCDEYGNSTVSASPTDFELPESKEEKESLAFTLEGYDEIDSNSPSVAAQQCGESTNKTVNDTLPPAEFPQFKENKTPRLETSFVFKNLSQLAPELFEFDYHAMAIPSSNYKTITRDDWKFDNQQTPVSVIITISDDDIDIDNNNGNQDEYDDDNFHDYTADFLKFVQMKYAVSIVWAHVRSMRNAFPFELKDIFGFAEAKEPSEKVNAQASKSIPSLEQPDNDGQSTDAKSDKSTTGAFDHCRRKRLRAKSTKYTCTIEDPNDTNDDCTPPKTRLVHEDLTLKCRTIDNDLGSKDTTANAECEETSPEEEETWKCISRLLKSCESCKCAGCSASSEENISDPYEGININEDKCPFVPEILTQGHFDWLLYFTKFSLREHSVENIVRRNRPRIREEVEENGCITSRSSAAAITSLVALVFLSV